MFLIAVAPTNAKTRIVTGKSDADLALTATFNGKEILLYGAIETDEEAPPNVIISVRGPDQSTTISKKEHVMGLWVNSKAVKFRNAPSYIGLISNQKIDEIITQTQRLKYKIGFNSYIKLTGLSSNILDGESFSKALIDLRMEQKKFYLNESGVRVEGSLLFSGTIPLPADLIEGVYEFDIFVVQNKIITAQSSSVFPVYKTGLGRWIYHISAQNPVIYGCLAIALAILSALFVNQFVRIFRR